ncbi:hypothetical protein ABZ215_05580 [Amycolatopsis sp. NPDC006131]
MTLNEPIVEEPRGEEAAERPHGECLERALSALTGSGWRIDPAGAEHPRR